MIYNLRKTCWLLSPIELKIAAILFHIVDCVKKLKKQYNICLNKNNITKNTLSFSLSIVWGFWLSG